MRAAVAATLALLALAAAPATATGHEPAVGIVPAEIHPAPLLKGTSYVFTVNLQNTHPHALHADLSVDGAAAPWIELPMARVLVPSASSTPIDVAVAVPGDAANGLHQALLTARFDASGVANGTGFSVSPAVASRLTLEVTGEERRELRLLHLRVPDAEEGAPPVLQLAWENAGNVRERPVANVTVRRLSDGAVVHEGLLPPFDLPPLRTTTAEAALPVLDYGQYVARVAVGGTIREDEFKVVPPGTLSKDARLSSLDHPPWLAAGEPVRIDGVLANVGDAAIGRAVLTVEVWRDGRLVAILASEPTRLAAGEEARVPVYFTPTEGGVHTLKGVVTYDGWRTAESESLLNVEAPPATGPPWFLALFAVAAVAAAAAYLLVRGRRRS